MGISLSIAFAKQLRNGLCGAACAQMILHSRNLVTLSAGDQESLWADIKSNTTPPSGLALGSISGDDSACEAFKGKICETCLPQSFCWCAFPTILRKTLLQRDPALGVRVITSKNELSIQKKIVACLKRQIAPIVLAAGGTHWVVVDGVDESSPKPISLLDPAFDAQAGITMDHWKAFYLDDVDCGRYDQKYLVLGKDS
jgi:hypothetical protein